MSRLIRMTLSVVLLASVAVAPADAGSRREKPERSWNNLAKLRVGEEIQVVYQEEQYLNGRFQRFTPDSISVQWGTVNRHEETIPRKEVIRVIASRPSQRVKNTLVGLGAGALIGGYFGAMSGRRDEAIGALAAGAAIGTIAGALSSPDATIYETQRAVARAELKTRRSVEPLRSRRLDPSWDNLRTLHIFQEIRVLDQERRVYNGRFYSVSDEAISFDGTDGEINIERDEVLEVSIERPQEENFSGWVGVERMMERVTIYSNYSSQEINAEDRRAGPSCNGRIVWNRLPTWNPVSISGPRFLPPAPGTCGGERWETMTSY